MSFCLTLDSDFLSMYSNYIVWFFFEWCCFCWTRQVNDLENSHSRTRRHWPETTRSADLESSPKDDFTRQVYFPLSSIFTTGITKVVDDCVLVTCFDANSRPSLVHENWTGLVPEPKEHISVPSNPTDVSEISSILIFGGTDASDLGIASMDNNSNLTTKFMMISKSSCIGINLQQASLTTRSLFWHRCLDCLRHL